MSFECGILGRRRRRRELQEGTHELWGGILKWRNKVGSFSSRRWWTWLPALPRKIHRKLERGRERERGIR